MKTNMEMQTEEMMRIRDKARMEACIHEARKGVLEAREDMMKNERLRELYKLLSARRKAIRW